LEIQPLKTNDDIIFPLLHTMAYKICAFFQREKN
jgi:hypothetical protein